MIKINKAKLAPRLVLVILLFTLISGFTISFGTAYDYGRNRGNHTSYDFEATAILSVFVFKDSWTEDGISYMTFYKENDLVGTINGIEFTGHTKEDFYAKTDLATGVTTVYALARFYINWEGLSGQFSGPLYVKGIAPDLKGIYILPGYEDFARSFLLGRLWTNPDGTIGLSGTILHI